MEADTPVFPPEDPLDEPAQHPFKTTRRQMSELDLAAHLLSEGRSKKIARNDLIKWCVTTALQRVWEEDLRRKRPENPAEELRALEKKGKR